MMKEFPLNRVFTLIEPGPVLLVATANGRKKNIMTISWSTVLDFDARFAIVTGPWNYSFQALMKSRECVVAIPSADLMEKTVDIGACSGDTENKFQKFSLTPLKAEKVKAPLIAECPINIECRVLDYLESCGIVVLSALKAWRDPQKRGRIRFFHAVGDGTFIMDGEHVTELRSHMLSKLPPGI